MPMPVAPHRAGSFQGSWIASSNEGRNCECSHRATARLLFPALDARPGPWLLLLAGACSFVAIRALEMASL